MRNVMRLGGRQLVGATALAAGVVALAATLQAPVVGAAEPCCFTNDRYEGVCKVTPGQDETCQSVLDYLNSPMSTGKSYCGSTTVRGGWAQAACKTEQPATGRGAREGMPDGKAPGAPAAESRAPESGARR